MAILVTGAAGLVGRAAVAALLRQGVEHVRAVVRDPAQVGDLRRLGAKVALLDATDPDGLAAAMDGVFTACSLTGSLWPRPQEDPSTAVVDPAQVFLAAAKAAGVRRVVVCSPAAVGTPGAAGNAHLAAKAEVERMVAASGLEHAILRCAHVLGPGGRLLGLLAAGAAGPGQPSGAPGREPVLVPGDGRQRVAPVWVGDVADAIATADDAAELAGRHLVCWPGRPSSPSTSWSTPSTAAGSPSATWAPEPAGRRGGAGPWGVGRVERRPGRGAGRRLPGRPGPACSARAGPGPAGRDAGPERRAGAGRVAGPP